MKKFIVLVLFICFCIISVVQARPFLVCDAPETLPDNYAVVLNTGAEIATPAPLHYDLVTLEPGVYVVTVKAVSTLWGASDPSIPLDFTKPALTPVTGLVISPE